MENTQGGANEEINEVKSGSDSAQAKVDSVNHGNTDAVSYETLQRSIDKEKRVKGQLKEALDRLAAYEQRDQEAEEKKLTEQQEWKQLAKTKDQQLQDALNQLANVKKAQTDAIRRDAVIQELGGVKNPAYLSFANTEMIEVIDGKPDIHAVKLVAEEFKKNHADLLSTPTRQAKMTSRAAVSDNLEDIDLSDANNRESVLNSIF